MVTYKVGRPHFSGVLKVGLAACFVANSQIAESFMITTKAHPRQGIWPLEKRAQ